MKRGKQIDPLKKANQKANEHNRKSGLSFLYNVKQDAGNVPVGIDMFNNGFANNGQSAVGGGMCERLDRDTVNDLLSLPELSYNEFYHIGNIVGNTDFKQEGFHITKDINQCINIKNQKHPEAEHLYKVKFNPKNGIDFDGEPGGWRARDIAGMILHNLGEQDVDEVHKIEANNISKNLSNYFGELRRIQKSNDISANGFRKIADILNNCGYNYISYTNNFEAEEGESTKTVIPLQTNLQYQTVYNFNKGGEGVANEQILESKTDEQKLINFAGEKLANRFFDLRRTNRLKAPYDDPCHWLKKDVTDLEDFINEFAKDFSKYQRGANESLNEVKQQMGEGYDVYSVITLEDILGGMVGNVDEDTFDETLKLYSGIMRFFGKKVRNSEYDEVFAYVDNDLSYDPDYYQDIEIFDLKRQNSPIKGLRLYQYGLAHILVEEYNDKLFLYTDNEDVLYDYLRKVDSYNNGEFDDKPEEFDFNAKMDRFLNEAVSGEYSDKFRTLINKATENDDVSLASEVANKILNYLPEEDAEDCWRERGFDQLEKKFILDESLFDSIEE